MRHHHHSYAPAVTAALVGAAAAALVGWLAHKDTTASVYQLHEEVHAVAQQGAARFNALNESAGRNFMGAAAGQQHLADAINSIGDVVAQLRSDLFPNRAAPGGDEPPA
jgi:hypothetical protein